MATLNGSLHSIKTLTEFGWDQRQQAVIILFTLAGTYAQADDAALQNIPQLIQQSRKNGKVVTVERANPAYWATRATDNSFLTLKTVAIAGSGQTARATFEVCDANFVELSDGPMPAQLRPFELMVWFSETNSEIAG